MIRDGSASAFSTKEVGSQTWYRGEVDTEDAAEREQIAEAIRQSITRGSAVALRTVHLVGPQWMIKTSSGKNARLANRDKYLAEAGEAA